MRPAPSLSRLPAFPVTGAIGLVAIAATLAYWKGWNVAPFLTDARAFSAQPWRLVTSIFPHADILHLAFNLYWLWVFGTLLEEQLGHVVMLCCVLLLAAGSSAAQYAFSASGGIGLSGVGYGQLGMLYAAQRRDSRFSGAIDAQTLKLFVAWFVLCVVLTVTNVWVVGNFAHGAGALLGLVLGVAIARPPKAAANIIRNLSIGGAILMTAAMFSLGAWLRPFVNLSKDAGLADGQRGYEALTADRYAEAVQHFERAVRLTPKEPSLWFNLGIAYLRTEKFDQAKRAFERAHALAPDDPKYALPTPGGDAPGHD